MASVGDPNDWSTKKSGGSGREAHADDEASGSIAFSMRVQLAHLMMEAWRRSSPYASRSASAEYGRQRFLADALAFCIAVVVFLKNAWIAEDAYIVFRSIEQLFAGNGPIWNPHERVQVFTSPLWFGVLILVRSASANLYLGTMAVSFVLWIATLKVLRDTFQGRFSLLLLVLVLCASSGFYDYTSSGLENVLAYFLIAVYLRAYLPAQERVRTTVSPATIAVTHLAQMCVAFGLLMVTRHDLATLLLPATVAMMWQHSRRLSLGRRTALYASVVGPLTLFTAFSVVYFGFPFPNTAYAKLNTGIEQWLLWQQGGAYLLVSVITDFATLVVIGAVLVRILTVRLSYYKYLAVGLVCNALYVVSVGGDFMQGRFLSYAYLLAAILAVAMLEREWPRHDKAAVVVLGVFLILYVHTPFNSPLLYKNKRYLIGIADERGFYFDRLSLLQFIKTGHDDFPAGDKAARAREAKASSKDVIVFEIIGVFGYVAGIDKIIVDNHALSDPLLARLPVTGPWRIGHFSRGIPEGYLETLRSGRNELADPGLREYYDKLRIVTQSKPLFTEERLKTIVLFNLGAYDHLKEHK